MEVLVGVLVTLVALRVMVVGVEMVEEDDDEVVVVVVDWCDDWKGYWAIVVDDWISLAVRCSVIWLVGWVM